MLYNMYLWRAVAHCIYVYCIAGRFACNGIGDVTICLVLSNAKLGTMSEPAYSNLIVLWIFL